MGDYFFVFLCFVIQSQHKQSPHKVPTPSAPTHKLPISMLLRSRIKRPEHAANYVVKHIFKTYTQITTQKIYTQIYALSILDVLQKHLSKK